MMRDPIIRFWDHVPVGAAGCWEWQGYRNNRGYGQFTMKGRTWRAHRLVWTTMNGPIPDGMVIMHVCDNPPCVNPEHLRIGSLSDNAQDSVSKGRHVNAQRTHCTHGHPFDELNTYIHSDGRRQCKQCRADSYLRNRSPVEAPANA